MVPEDKPDFIEQAVIIYDALNEMSALVREYDEEAGYIVDWKFADEALKMLENTRDMPLIIGDDPYAAENVEAVVKQNLQDFCDRLKFFTPLYAPQSPLGFHKKETLKEKIDALTKTAERWLGISISRSGDTHEL